MAHGEHSSKEGCVSLGLVQQYGRFATRTVVAAGGGEYSLELCTMTSKSGHQTDVYKPTVLPLLTDKPSA